MTAIEARPTAFAAYVSLTSGGRWGIGSIFVGSVLTVILWIAMTVLVSLLASVLLEACCRPSYGSVLDRLAAFEDPDYGMVVLLLSIASLWPTVWVVLRLVHRRRMRTVLGFRQRLVGGDMARALAACALVAASLALLPTPLDHVIGRSGLSLERWLLLLVPVCLVVFLQASGEEVLFRGYLMQLLARRFSSPLLWAVLPAALFTIGHWYDGVPAYLNAAALASIAAFALAATWLVVRTGNLSAVFGLHTGNNIYAVLVVGIADGAGPGMALWSLPPMDHPAWTPGVALWLAAVDIGGLALVLLLLLHPKSPLMVEAGPVPVSSPVPLDGPVR